MKTPLPQRPASVCLLPFSRVSSHPVPSAPGTGPHPEPGLGLEIQEDFGNDFGCSSGGSCPDPLADQDLRAPLPGLSCCCFISQEPRCLFSNEVVFLELKSNSALRGTRLWLEPQLEPGLDRRLVGALPWLAHPHPLLPLGLSFGCRTPSVCSVQPDSFLPAGLGPWEYWPGCNDPHMW